VRFFREDVGTHTSSERKHAVDVAYRNVIRKAYKLAAYVARRDPADALSIVPVDDCDNYLVVGSTAPLIRWIEGAAAQGLIVCCEQLESRRVGVIAQGGAPASATQRSAYKEVIREQKMSKAARDLSRRATHTRDDDELADLCRCTTCGAAVNDHDDEACDYPVFVADTQLVGDSSKDTRDNRPKGKSRKARIEGTRRHVAIQRGRAFRSACKAAAEAGTSFGSGSTEGQVFHGKEIEKKESTGCHPSQLRPSDYCTQCGAHNMTHINGECPE
jgi:hypothetical protein